MITTKYGDEGYTNLNDIRICKDSQVFSLLGTLDEAMAILQLVAATHQENSDMLYKQVDQLYEISAIAAGYDMNLVKDFENQISNMENSINTVTNLVMFSLRYKTEVAARYNMARTIIRRAEREFVSFCYNNKMIEEISEEEKLIMRYLNRMSDWLFIMAERTN